MTDKLSAPVPEQKSYEQSEATKRYLEKMKDPEYVRTMWSLPSQPVPQPEEKKETPNAEG